MFKKFITFIMLIVSLAAFSGCATIGGGGTTSDQQQIAILTAIELAGYNLGYYVGKSKTDADDLAIANAYKLIRTGGLTPEEIAVAFSKLKLENPQLTGSLVIVLKNMGATFNADGTLLSLTGIPVEYWDRAAAGYSMGFEFGKAGQKGLSKSAVLKFIPKK